ncbi:hypothetical protein D3C86_2220930 [compost metagenome]
MPVITVVGDDVIIVVERRDGADGDGFLPDIQVQEAPDLGVGVALGALLLEAPDEGHLAVPFQG